MEITYSVCLTFADQTILCPRLHQTDAGIYEATETDLSIRLTAGTKISLSVHNPSKTAIDSVAWKMLCRDKNIADCRVPLPCSTKHSGITKLEQETPESTMITGLFYGSDKPCLFLGTQLPQNNIHRYQVRRIDDDAVEITGKTEFTVGQSTQTDLISEITLVITGDTPREAMQTYAEHLPDIPVPAPTIGWNSWDYYFTTISSEAVRENLEFIKNDPKLNGTLKAVVIDDGWETCVGEWYANHRFPEGLSYLADLIKSYGMIPGIWTNGAQTESLSEPGLRHPDYFTLDEFGIPFTVDGKLVIDPTHPAAEKFILDTYTRLYDAGFRIFKVDFISTIVQAKRFYDPACGPYEAVRRLVRLIRQAVGSDSHILGCSFPAECGPKIVDSARISVDIHNHWLHALWIMEFMQVRFWQNGKLFRSDPDMMVVRGTDTSLEEETNVYNPWNFVPPGKDRFTSRWRRGPVFNKAEAETWANLVVFSGGDIMLGDRLSMLNSTGLDIVYRHLEPHMHAAVPLDLGDREVSEYWYDRHTSSLLIVNTEETARTMVMDFDRYDISAPTAVSCSKPYTYEKNILKILLQPHESAVVIYGE